MTEQFLLLSEAISRSVWHLQAKRLTKTHFYVCQGESHRLRSILHFASPAVSLNIALCVWPDESSHTGQSWTSCWHRTCGTGAPGYWSFSLSAGVTYKLEVFMLPFTIESIWQSNQWFHLFSLCVKKLCSPNSSWEINDIYEFELIYTTAH